MSGRSRRLSFFSMKYRAIIHFPLSELDHKYLMEIVVLLQLNLHQQDMHPPKPSQFKPTQDITASAKHNDVTNLLKATIVDLTTDCLDLVSLFIFSSLCFSFSTLYAFS